MKSVWTLSLARGAVRIPAAVLNRDVIGAQLRNQVARQISRSLRGPVAISDARPNPTLVHHGLAKKASHHVVGHPIQTPLADLYGLTDRQAKAVGRSIARALKIKLAILSNARTPASLARHPRVNPARQPVVGETWTTLHGGQCKILAVQAGRIQVLHLGTGKREWIDRLEFGATYRPPRRNPPRLPRRRRRALASGRFARSRYLAEQSTARAARRDEKARSARFASRKNPARREIPPGKVSLAEYGSFPPEDRAQVTKLDEGFSPQVRAQVMLVTVSPGWEPAGSVARWTNGYHAVWWYEASGSRQGRQYKELEPAQAHFDRLMGTANPSRSLRARIARSYGRLEKGRKQRRAVARSRAGKASFAQLEHELDRDAIRRIIRTGSSQARGYRSAQPPGYGERGRPGSNPKRPFAEPSRTRLRGTRVTKPHSPEDRIAALRQIVSEKQYAKIDGVMVDLFSASTILAVYDAINDANKAKYAAMPVQLMASIAFKLAKKNPRGAAGYRQGWRRAWAACLSSREGRRNPCGRHRNPREGTNRDFAIRTIRDALKRRSGHAWSVTGGRGTSWGWIRITLPPGQRTWSHRLKPGMPDYPENYEGYDSGHSGGSLSPAQRAELAGLLGLDSVSGAGESVPGQHDFYEEYMDRAQGRAPERLGVPAWDNPRASFQAGERVSVPYTGRTSYFGRKVSRTREKATVAGYMEDGTVHVNVVRGAATESHYFPPAALRRLPAPRGSRSRRSRIDAERDRIESRERRERAKATRAALAKAESDLACAEAQARELYPQGDEQPSAAYRTLRAKMTRLGNAIAARRSILAELAPPSGPDPFAIANPPEDRARAEQTFRMWHEREPDRTTLVRGPTRVPRVLAKVGTLEYLGYRSDKWAGTKDNRSGKARLYEHRTKRPKPVLASDGRDVFIVGGKMKVTADGFVN